MAENNQFSQLRRKIYTTFENIRKAFSEINQNINIANYRNLQNSSLKILRSIEIPAELSVYNLYDWKGTTYYAGSPPGPQPSELYHNEGNQWWFKYPVFDFHVSADTTPTDLVGGDEWEYQDSMYIITASHRFTNFPEWAILYAHVIPILNKEVPAFFHWHRWVKESDDVYRFEFYGSIKPIDEEAELSLKIYFYNERVLDAIQPSKAENIEN